MTNHTRIRNLLYDYVCNALIAEERDMMEKHISSCTRCMKDVDDLRAVREISFDHLQNAAEERDAEFWKNFSVTVEHKIRSEKPGHKQSFGEEWNDVFTWLIVRQRAVVAIGGAVAILLAVLLVKNPFLKNPLHDQAQNTGHDEARSIDQAQSPNVVQANERIGQYFRKSRTLLVGLTNMKLEENEPVDLSAEQAISRQLVHEARYLKSQPIDVRSAQLIGDLEKILIELANLKEEHDIPNVEVIRAGIHQENLLFKIRMTEARFSASGYRNVKEH